MFMGRGIWIEAGGVLIDTTTPPPDESWADICKGEPLKAIGTRPYVYKKEEGEENGVIE